MTTNPVPMLSDAEVAEVAAMFPHAEYQPEVGAMPLCSFCDGSIDDHKANCVVPHVHTLCATVRALRANERQGELCEECEQWSNDEQGNPRTFLVCGACWNKLQQTNTALREQQTHLREQRETIKFWQRHIARMGKLLGTVAMDIEVETAVKQLQSQLAQVTAERDRYTNALESATKGIKCDD